MPLEMICVIVFPFSHNVTADFARLVREPDWDSSGHGPQDCAAGPEEAAASSGDASGRLQCGECTELVGFMSVWRLSALTVTLNTVLVCVSYHQTVQLDLRVAGCFRVCHHWPRRPSRQYEGNKANNTCTTKKMTGRPTVRARIV